MGPCKYCIEKSEEIRDILRPFVLDHVEPVGGVRLIAEELAKLKAGASRPVEAQTPEFRVGKSSDIEPNADYKGEEFF